MGNDGGSIPKRRELVKEAQRNPSASEVKESQKEHLQHRWSQCPLSHAPLRRPVVSDCAGLLYNKDAVLQYLLPAESSPLNTNDCEKLLQGRIKGLKDVVEVLLETHPGSSATQERWMCPVTTKELGAAVKAVYLVPCGHAFSHEAIKEMKTEECPQCNQSYEAGNIITLFPSTEAEKDLLQSRIQTLTDDGLSHSLKKRAAPSKKRKANKPVEGEEAAPSSTEPTKPATQKPKSIHTINPTSSSIPHTKQRTNINHAATANLTARVLEEERERKKRRMLIQGETGGGGGGGESQNLKSLFSSSKSKKRKGNGEGKGDDGEDRFPSGDFMTRGFSIRG